MANPLPAQFLNFPIVDPKTGLPTSDFQRWMTQTISRLANLNLNGTLNGGGKGQVDPAVLAAQVANLDANGIVLPNGVDMSRAYINKFLQYIPDGGGRYAALVPNLATQDNLPDGASYSRTLAAYVASGVPYNFLGAWNSATAYLKGAEVSSGNNYWLALLPSTNSAPAIGNANWQLLGPTSLDSLGDGTTYSRTLAAYVSSGVPYNFQGAWSSVTAYLKGAEVSSGGNYWLALANNTNSAPPSANWQMLGPTSLDNVADGASYSRVLGAWVSDGVPYNFQGAWSSVTVYSKGAEVSSNGNYWLALANNTNSAPPSANWQLLGPTSLDNLSDGTNYLRTTASLGSALIVDNPNFQNGTAGWTAGGATVAVDTASPYTNGKSLKVTTATQFAGMLSKRVWKVSPGDVIYASSQWKSDGTFAMGGGFTVYDGSGAVLVFHDLGSYSGTTWQQFTTTFTMPANADHFTWQMDRTDAAGGSHSAWVTDIQLVRASRTSDVQDNAISQAASGSTGVVNGTVNVWMDGAAAALAGGGTATTISFYFTLENGSAVAQAMNWRVLRNATVLISGSTTVGPGGSTFQLLPANIIDVGPPSGTNTYKVQCEFTTGASAITGFQSSNIAITNLSK